MAAGVLGLLPGVTVDRGDSEPPHDLVGCLPKPDRERPNVRDHRIDPMRKLDLHDVTELVKYAMRKGVVQLE